MTPVNSSKPFWTWFQANAESLTMLNDLEADESKRLLDDMQVQLDAYAPGLSYEIGEPTPSGRTLTFSAEGDMEFLNEIYTNRQIVANRSKSNACVVVKS